MSEDAQAVAEMVEGSDESIQTEQPGVEQPSWSYADGVPGSGDTPEWFKSDKYSSVAEQARAYKELEGKFGAFVGAPENYDLSLRDELTERGIEFDEKDPLYEKAVEFAKSSNMSQDGFSDMLNLYGMAKVAEADAAEQAKLGELELLGDNAQSRINNIVKWGKANLSADMYQGLEDMATSAASVKALEKIIAMTRSAPISPDDVQPVGGVTPDELRKMQFETDEHGNRRMQTDKEFRARFKKLADQVWGNTDHRTIIG